VAARPGDEISNGGAGAMALASGPDREAATKACDDMLARVHIETA